METTKIKTIDEFIKAIPDFPEDLLKISDSCQKLLEIVYTNANNLNETQQGSPYKPPLIISFHPKVSLLNNNIHETYLAEKIANKLGMVPIWIPYIYDTGFKNLANKIRRPTYVYFEGKHIPLRSSAAIRGNIMATEKASNDKEVRAFFRELVKHETANLTRLKSMLNKFNFGHFLFDLKSSVSKTNKKIVRQRFEYMEKLCLNAIKDTKKIDESLGNISVALLKEFGINVGIVMMDDILADITEIIFKEVIESPSIKDDPSILENLFLAYDLKSRERTPILYAGQGDFIGYDDASNRVFDGKLDELIAGLRTHKVLPTGDLIMVLFTAMGCKLVLGGTHTIEYYPDYFKKSYSVLKETSFNSKMQLLSYGKIRFMDTRNMTDIMSAVRVFDKVGSRNYIQKGNFTIPNDIVDHLNFLSGDTEVPVDYKTLLDDILKNQKSETITALEKEEARYKEVMEIVNKDPEELLKDPASLKKWIKGTKFEGLHPVRLEVLLENLRQDIEMRLRMLKENINFEQHILGGTIEKEEEGEIIYDGILIRSNRYPSLLELVYYNSKPLQQFELAGHLEDHESEWIWQQFIHDKAQPSELDTNVFSDYKSVFEKLIPKESLVPQFKVK